MSAKFPRRGEGGGGSRVIFGRQSTYAEEAALGNELVNGWSIVLRVRYKICEKILR